MNTISTGYIVATSYKGNGPDEWTARVGCATKPSASEMGQYRQAFKNQRVRTFTEAEWDALPYGAQSGDWVWVFGERYPRERDGIRR